jgi:bacterioferritin (cytochrome b1)
MERLVDALNLDLARKWGTIGRYRYQAVKAVGSDGARLHDLLLEEVRDELKHARLLFRAINDLGGTPTGQAIEFERNNEIKDTLVEDIGQEEKDTTNFLKHAGMAGRLSRFDIKAQLELIAADEDRHAKDLQTLLSDL